MLCATYKFEHIFGLQKVFILPTGLKELNCLQISWLQRIISCESLVWTHWATWPSTVKPFNDCCCTQYSLIPIQNNLKKRDVTVTEFKMQVTSAAWLPAATVVKPQYAVIQPGASEPHEARNHHGSRQTLQKASEMFAETAKCFEFVTLGRTGVGWKYFSYSFFYLCFRGNTPVQTQNNIFCVIPKPSTASEV